MALRITLKPEEKILIGSTVLTNGPRPSEFVIEGENIPVLRAKQIMRIHETDTPCKRLYYVIQALYIHEGDRNDNTLGFMRLAQEIAAAAPSLQLLIAEISIHVLSNELYKALRSCRTLIAQEAPLLARAAGGGGDDARPLPARA
jgi:flagellar protein FlbT